LLDKVGLGEDEALIDRVFWVFDEDGGGYIGFKELGIGLEMLKDNTFDEKLDTFFDLCDEDNSGTIDKKEFYNLLRMNATTSYEDRERLKFYVNQIFNYFEAKETDNAKTIQKAVHLTKKHDKKMPIIDSLWALSKNYLEMKNQQKGRGPKKGLTRE
jgi:EF-hand domain pair